MYFACNAYIYDRAPSIFFSKFQYRIYSVIILAQDIGTLNETFAILSKDFNLW